MPGSTPATSQLDWLSSTTAMIVLSWSKATRDLLKSFSWGIRALRQLFASDDGAISSPPAPYHLSTGCARGDGTPPDPAPLNCGRGLAKGHARSAEAGWVGSKITEPPIGSAALHLRVPAAKGVH